MTKKQLPYGSWNGVISAEMVATRCRISSLKADGDSLIFSVSRGGQSYLYRKAPNGPAVQINEELPVYGGLGYGGGDFGVRDGNTVFCAGNHGLRLHQSGRDGSRRLTQDILDSSTPVIHPDGHHLAYLTSDDTHDQIALLDMEGYNWPVLWIRGADFYMQPQWSPDGRRFAWAQWDHPNMPWSGSSVWVADVDGDFTLRNVRMIAGGTEKPASQPHFTPDGKSVSFIETQEDWDDLILLNLETNQRQTIIRGNGFSLAEPAFIQDIRSYTWFSDGARLVYTRSQGTRQQLRLLNLRDGSDISISAPRFTSISQVCVTAAGLVAAIVTGPLDFAKVITIDPESPADYTVIYQSNDMILDESFVSVPREIQWEATNGDTVYGLYYPPVNPNWEWHGAPPAIFQIHGGPTGQAGQGFSAETAYFNSLGYAYIRVNYRGSSGFGRKYLESLNGHWGEYDTEDAVTCLRYLTEQGLVDPKRTLITGGSSGGYAVLNALTQYPDAFAAGASLYGVSNLFSLAADTHKLEAHYTDSLVGTLPEAEEKFRAWSPMLHMDRVRVPLAIFQGSADKVVPPNQSEGLLSRLNVPHVFRLYDGEGHGFRMPEHVRDYLETLHAFLQQYLG